MLDANSYFSQPGAAAARKILLLASQPTPNGRLHLGHIAGPFLRMDVLNRHFRTRGHDALLCTGVDSFESHVLLRAHRDGVTASDTRTRFTRLIVQDLEAALIQCDRFLNPAEGEHLEEFKRWNREVVERLKRSSAIRVRNEQIPRGVRTGRVIAGCWIAGDCPSCSAKASGYCCSNCGHQFRPDELKNVRSREWDEPLEWVTIPSLFLEIADSTPLLQVSPSYPRALATVRSFLERQQNLVRLSAPGDYGVPIEVEGSTLPQVLFTYADICFHLMQGESFRALRGFDQNGFDPGSEIEVVGSFGSDNTVTYLAGMHGSLVAAGYRPFKHLLINEMMRLEGEPFTTSGGHAIWVGDMVNGAQVHPDLLRNHLARVNPEEEPTNFTVDGLVETTRSLAERWTQVHAIADGVRGGRSMPAVPGELLERLSDLLRRQDLTLDLEKGVRIGVLPALIEEWLDGAGAAVDSGLAYWWLKALTLVAYPLMPAWSSSQWTALGHPGTPSCSAFPELRQPVGTAKVRYEAARRNDVAACLPTLSRTRG